MASQRPAAKKSAKSSATSTPGSTGLALPAWPTQTQAAIDPTLQTSANAAAAKPPTTASAQAAATAAAVAQAASGYLNSTPAYPYTQSSYYSPATQAYYQQYQAAAAAAGTPGTSAGANTPGAQALTYTYAQQYYQQMQAYNAALAAANPSATANTVTPSATGATSTTQPYGSIPVVTPQRMYSTSTGANQKAATAATTAATTTTAANAQSTSTNAQALHTANVAQLNDALGSAGVDLRAEEEAMARQAPTQQTSTMGFGSTEDRSKKQNFLDPAVLGAKVKDISKNHDLKVTDTAVTYIALALQSRLSTIVENTISASDHRTRAQYNRPPALYPLDENSINSGTEPTPVWNELVRRDVSKQLAVLEKVEREEENRIRRRRKERNENESIGMDGVVGTAGGPGDDGGEEDEDGEGGGKKKKKKKKEGPGITARNMSDDVRKKMSDMVANDFAGGFAKKYSWMSGGAAAGAGGGGGGGTSNTTAGTAAKPNVPSTTPAKPTNAPAAPATNGAITVTATSTGGPTTGGSFVRPFVSARAGGSGSNPTPTTSNPGAIEDERRLTLTDLMFVVGKERGHGAGRGSAKVLSAASGMAY